MADTDSHGHGGEAHGHEHGTDCSGCSKEEHGHGHEGNGHGHGHEGHGHGHTHEHMSDAGKFDDREPPLVQTRDFSERAFTIGIGGPVGSGKTALVLALCRHLRDKYSLAVVTNDIFTKEDCEFLTRNEALPAERISCLETGGCPHAAIREDISGNLVRLEELSRKFHPDFMFIESGGDNLAANFSRELSDYTIYVVDVAGGDKVPRKGGPGVTQSDLLIINKTDLAEAVGADLKVMERDAARMRGTGPVVFAQVKHKVGVDDIAQHILRSWRAAVPAAAAVAEAGAEEPSKRARTD
mmetsp:Transcript_47847/g.126922  ORF Transcript_47847/g.126922 Transcript_47847/m.126922 type:complete len:297 (-) Transcript_47847:76-966(-)